MDIIFINPNCLVNMLKKSGIRLGIIEYSKYYVNSIENDIIKIGTDIYDIEKLEKAIKDINKYFGVKYSRFIINYLDFQKSNNYLTKFINSLKLNFNLNKVKGSKYYLTINQNILEDKIDINLYTLLNANLFYNDNNYLVINEESTLSMFSGKKSTKIIDIKDKDNILDIIKYMIRFNAIKGRVDLESRLKRIL